MLNLRELYQEVILDHGKNPRNFCKCAVSNHEAEGYNPLCGDKISLYLLVENDTIENACFLGNGCAISTASASLMTEAIKGKTLAEVKSLFRKFHEALTQEGSVANLGKLEILTGVKAFPMRVKCATLAWHTLQSALEDVKISVTTK